jgi:hypothetical protein
MHSSRMCSITAAMHRECIVCAGDGDLHMCGPVGGSVVSLPYDRHVNLIVRVRDPPLVARQGATVLADAEAPAAIVACVENGRPRAGARAPVPARLICARGGDADLRACSARTWWEVRGNARPIRSPDPRTGRVPTERPGAGKWAGWRVGRPPRRTSCRTKARRCFPRATRSRRGLAADSMNLSPRRLRFPPLSCEVPGGRPGGHGCPLTGVCQRAAQGMRRSAARGWLPRGCMSLTVRGSVAHRQPGPRFEPY